MKNNSKRLQPIKTTSLADQVEESLMKYLKSNNFSTGDPLPKETELAAYLGVSRNIVREALSRLRMLGIVESKKRKGMILAEPDLLSGVERVLDPSILSDEAMKNIFELRLVLEVGMGDLLFARLKDEDIKILENIATKEANDTRLASLKVRLSYEIEFHSKLYEMSGNDTLKRFQKMLLPVFNYMMEVEATLDKKPEKGNIDHFDLIETLKNGTPAQFRENMREHLTPHYQRL
ncbi:GntR family transcriptional regulator [Fulvivirgaceae bacterium BMA10]|uniref:GntR family transcriptional regulator n=1 Tax=Splendidivirga corallicola TaxID=3051826 RepID=A0ABT8KY22_9BACT|nr:GntR family transcriptional regulator [Fulvivirgaceae bacterium BMA10]